MRKSRLNFRHVFRLIFVIFFLYLTGDAFYRWDGFRYYASFYEFLPSVALISILWSITALLTTLLFWLSFKVITWIFRCMKLRFNDAHVFLNMGFLMVIGIIAWTGKKHLWSDMQTTLNDKLAVAITTVLLSVFLTWLLRNKAEHMLSTVSERLTPLVWIFSIIVGLSLPLVIFYALWEPHDKRVLSRTTELSEAVGNRPNIILVTYDALTTKDMSLYGYHRETTPFISEWAKTATVFTKAEAAANTTSQAVASLMTGKRVWTHRRQQSDAGKPAGIDIENLPLILKENGYYNMAFIANEIASVKKLGMSESFHIMPSSSDTLEPASLFGFIAKNLIKYYSAKIKLHDWILKEDFILSLLLQANIFRYPNKTEFPVEKVFDMLLREINNNAQEPFFAWAHLSPHAPYLPPEEYMGLFNASPKYRTAKSQYPLINARYYSLEQQTDADIIRARYDEFIRYCDKQFDYLIEQLSSQNKLTNTVIILSSDHGESFERGYFTHGGHFLFEEMTNIPLIIKKPEHNEGSIIDFPVEQTDIPATILDLAHIPVPSWMDGRSLAPLLHGNIMEPRPVFSMSMEEVHERGQISKGIYAVWEGEYKLIYHITGNETLLFNLNLDPYERNDISDAEPEISRLLLSLIQDNLEKANKRIKQEEYD